MAHSSPDPAEEAAFWDVPRVLGVELERFDHSGRQGAVDALLHYADGHIAALEVTSVAAEGRRQLYSLIGSMYRTIRLPGKWYWAVSVDDPRLLPELERMVGRIILKCEAEGIRHPEDVMWERLRDDADFAWLERSEVQLSGHPSSTPIVDESGEPVSYVTRRPSGSFVDEELTQLNAEVDSILEQQHVRRRLEKLSNSGYAERHLYILADDSAMPPSVSLALITPGVVPQDALALPDGLTSLWLRMYSRQVLVASRGGWAAHQLLAT